MKNMISTKFKYFFDGFGQYVVFTTKKQCKEYLKANPNINRIKDLKEIGIEEWNKISEHPRYKVFEIIDNVAVPMEIDIPKESEIHPTPLPYEKENCPNCLDQASIAASGQTTLCRTHEIRKPLIEVLADQNKVWTSHIEHTHCENCHNQPYQILYISSNFTPLHLCLQCGIKFDSLLNA